MGWIILHNNCFCVSGFLVLNLVCLILEAEFPFSCCLSHCLPPSSVCRMRRLWQYHCHPLLCALHFLSDLHYSTCERVLLSDGLWWELKLACSSLRFMVKDQYPICHTAWLYVSCRIQIAQFWSQETIWLQG
jgi:hypothetical protein